MSFRRRPEGKKGIGKLLAHWPPKGSTPSPAARCWNPRSPARILPRALRYFTAGEAPASGTLTLGRARVGGLTRKNASKPSRTCLKRCRFDVAPKEKRAFSSFWPNGRPPAARRNHRQPCRPTRPPRHAATTPRAAQRAQGGRMHHPRVGHRPAGGCMHHPRATRQKNVPKVCFLISF